MNDNQVDLIQMLKSSTISVASAISDFTPSGGVGSIPLKVSICTVYVCVCVCLCCVCACLQVCSVNYIYVHICFT